MFRLYAWPAADHPCPNKMRVERREVRLRCDVRGRGEILSISTFRDQRSAEESDDQALQFPSGHLAAFDIERCEVIGGEVLVSRARSEVLSPAHA